MKKEIASKKNSVVSNILDSINEFINQKPKIYDLLESDHRKVEKLMDQIEAEEDPNTKSDLIYEMVTELSAHAEAEEKVLYSPLKKTEEGEEITLEAIEEHKVIKTLLDEISHMRKDSPVRDAKLKVLKEVVTHHVKEEESELFSKAEDVYDTDEEIEIGQKFLKAKEKILTAH